MKKSWMVSGLAGALALLTTAGAQAWQYDSGTTFTLNQCARLSSTSVECSFRVQNNQQERPLFFSRWGISIAAPGGSALPTTRLFFDGQPLPFDQVVRLRRGQPYTLRAQFANFSGNLIRALSIDEAGTRNNIPLVGAAPSQGSGAATQAAASWQPVWRWANFSDGPRRVMVHGCYGAGRVANCYASVTAPNARKQPTSTPNVAYTQSWLMTFANQPVSGGNVRLKVGDLVFYVPVK